MDPEDPIRITKTVEITTDYTQSGFETVSAK